MQATRVAARKTEQASDESFFIVGKGSRLFSFYPN